VKGENQSNLAFSTVLRFQQFLHKGWKAIFILILFELALVYLTTSYSLQEGVIKQFIEFTQIFIPNIERVNAIEGNSTGAIRLYMAITFYVFLLKVVVFYLWIDGNSEHRGQLVISPETTKHEGSMGEWVAAPAKGKNKYPSKKPRSMFSRLIWSFLIIAFAFASIWVVFLSGWNSSTGQSVRYSLASGGVDAWLTWSLVWMTFLAFLVSIALQTVTGYFTFIKKYLRKNES